MTYVNSNDGESGICRGRVRDIGTSFLASKRRLESCDAKQFTLPIADRPGLLAEIASALWKQGVHIEAFSAELHTGKETFHLVVDKAAVAKKTFIDNGREVAEERR